VSRSPAWLAVAGAILVPGCCSCVAAFGEGAFGGGDVKLLVAVGLLAGFLRVVIAVFAGAMMAGVVIAVLLVTRRVTLKSYIPLGRSSSWVRLAHCYPRPRESVPVGADAALGARRSGGDVVRRVSQLGQ